MSAVFVGRQPIYSGQLKTVAYELLFRSGEQNQANIEDGERATAELLLNAFAEIGLERIVGKLPAFVNVPEEFLLNGHSTILPKDRVVLEILEDVRPTPEVLTAIKKLRDAGYTIAIDDFVYSAELLPLVELADIVKVELPAIAREDLPTHVKILRDHDVRILAEKVETQDEFEFCKELDFDYYQGYFFCRPTIVEGKQLPTNRLTTMRLISQLQKSTVSTSDISEIVRTEPALSYKLLRFVNSACCALSHKIESVQHAVAIAGIHRIKTLAYLTILTRAADTRSPQLIRLLLTRARMAELLATKMGQTRTDSYFLVGLFSSLDALLNVPMEEALDWVSVSGEVRDALMGGESRHAKVLNCVLQYERGNWAEVSCQYLDVDSIRDSYLEAINWVDETLRDGVLDA